MYDVRHIQNVQKGAFRLISKLITNYEETFAIILFGIGLCTLIFHRNMIKKIIGLNVMDTGLYLLLASMGYVEGAKAPIITDVSNIGAVADYVNPLPAGLVLTGIVVSVSVTAISLALSVRLYQRYHSLDLDEIYSVARKEKEEVF